MATIILITIAVLIIVGIVFFVKRKNKSNVSPGNGGIGGNTNNPGTIRNPDNTIEGPGGEIIRPIDDEISREITPPDNGVGLNPGVVVSFEKVEWEFIGQNNSEDGKINQIYRYLNLIKTNTLDTNISRYYFQIEPNNMRQIWPSTINVTDSFTPADNLVDIEKAIGVEENFIYNRSKLLNKYNLRGRKFIF